MPQKAKDSYMRSLSRKMLKPPEKLSFELYFNGHHRDSHEGYTAGNNFSSLGQNYYFLKLYKIFAFEISVNFLLFLCNV